MALTKTKRIELLEQRVAELMGEVERLKAEMMRLPEQTPFWPTYKLNQNPRNLPVWTIQDNNLPAY